MTKNYVILGLLTALIASLVVSGYLLLSKPTVHSVETKTKVVEVNKFSFPTIKDYLLRVGVSNAWAENTPEGKADCFSTISIDKASFAYCELR